MANRFVKSGATGAASGADWNNAWPTLQAITGLNPGDVVFVAGGNYAGEFTIRWNGSSAAPITIQRVRSTDAAATAAAGWNASYDAQIVHTPVNGTDAIYYPGGIGNWTKISGRVPSGWLIARAGSDASGSGVEIDQAAVSNVTFEFIDVEKPFPSTQSDDMRGFDLTPTNGTMSNITIRHCEARGGSAGMYLNLATNIVVEYCSFHDQDSLNVATWHTNVIYVGQITNSIFRFNKLYNITVEGLFFNDGNVSNIDIYGNLFYAGSIGSQSGARALQWTGTGNSAIRVYNNTFVGLPIGLQMGSPGTYSASFFQNNIVRACPQTVGSGWTLDHNYVDGADPFVSSATFDYHLASGSPAIGTGLNLGATYNLDYDGVVRAASGAWDVGAYAAAGGPPPPPPTVPNVVGLTQSAASSAITSVGFVTGTVTSANSATVATGLVISQNPASGATASQGSAVAFVVSLGPTQDTVPNVVGTLQASASSAIISAGLVVGTVTQQADPSPSTNVLSQNPAAGALVPPGSAVNLVVSSGPAPVSVPNVVGMTSSDAGASIAAANLTVGTTTSQNDPVVVAGKVLSQSPVAGTSVAAGSAVNLVTSLGPTPPPPVKYTQWISKLDTELTRVWQGPWLAQHMNAWIVSNPITPDP